MANQQKRESVKTKLALSLEAISRGERVEGIETLVSRASLIVDQSPVLGISSDYASSVLRDLTSYTCLRTRRKRTLIAGGIREITTEDEALNSLLLAESLAKQLFIPIFNKPTDFTNFVFSDIKNLGFSYVDAVVNGVADGYIPASESFDSKQRAVNIARHSLRVYDAYRSGWNREVIYSHLKRLELALSQSDRRFMRSYENVATTPKKISHGEKLQQELQEALTVRDPRGDLLFCPSVIFPIAHGGTEFGVRIANAYQNNGFDPIVYPLLFSMKTRKQRIPWVENDAPFLAKELEGKNVLLTEDWVTTGNTLRGIIQEVERTFPREIRVATIKRDREKSLLPFLDHYCFYVGEHAVYSGGKTDSLKDISI